jgi:hypothetical protein
MKRGRPLKRKTRLRARSLTNSYRRRERDLPFMKKVRKLPCIVRTWLEGLRRVGDKTSSWLMPTHVTPCGGRVQADHLGVRPYGWKAGDTTCAAMCERHHRERTDAQSARNGIFADFTAEQMREWCDWAIRRTRIEVGGMR